MVEKRSKSDPFLSTMDINPHHPRAIIRRGGSGALVRIFRSFRTGMAYAHKCFQPGKVEKEIRSQRTLASLFGEERVVRIENAVDDSLLMGAIPGQTLHEAVVTGGVRQQEVDEVWDAFARVWQETAQTHGRGIQPMRDMAERARRIQAAVLGLRIGNVHLESCVDLPLWINGERVATLRELLLRMESLYQPSDRLVLCHGDPNADNIIMDPRGWKLIDLEWCGWHDPRVPMSQLIAWWQLQGAVHERGNVWEDSQGLHLVYRLPYVSKRVQSVVARCWQFAADVGRKLRESDWSKQLRLQTATYLLGYQRFLQVRGQEANRVSLLGEGLKQLAALAGPQLGV